VSGAVLAGRPGQTGLVLVEHPGRLPTVAWSGVVGPGTPAVDVVAAGPPRVVLLPGLAAGRSYTIRRIDPSDRPGYEAPSGPVSGAALGDHGLPGPPPTTTDDHRAAVRGGEARDWQKVLT
jgi:hypothetical protein